MDEGFSPEIEIIRSIAMKLTEIIKKQILNEAGIEKSYKAIMQLEKVIIAAEKTFKKEKSGIRMDSAAQMSKSFRNLKQCWNRLYADTQEM